MISVLCAFPLALAPDGGLFQLPHALARCCLAPETPVLMAEATDMPISGMRPGDAVTGRSGEASRVTGGAIVPAGTGALYGINQHRPLLAAGAPHRMPGGWSALDRMATRLETPGMAVAGLTAGDVLVTATAVSGESSDALAPSPAVSFGRVLLQRLIAAKAAATDLLIGLMLDGDHSYISSSFVGRNKGDGNGGGQGPGPGSTTASGPGAAAAIGTTPVTGDLSSIIELSANETPAASGTQTGTGAAAAPSAPGAATGVPAAEVPAAEVPAAEVPAAVAEPSQEFSGDASPAGPDVSKSQEEDLISRGWQ